MPTDDAVTRQMFEAIERGDVDRLTELLAAGADPNARQADLPRWQPLNVAVDAIDDGVGTLALVETLLDHGAQVDGRGGEPDATPLLMAVCRGLLPCARLLLERGANPDVVGDEGATPLRAAVEVGDLAMVKLLLEYDVGASLDLAGGLAACTPLGVAARDGLVEIVEVLLAAGADPNAVDVDHYTALDMTKIGLAQNDTEEFANRIAKIRARLIGD